MGGVVNGTVQAVVFFEVTDLHLPTIDEARRMFADQAGIALSAKCHGVFDGARVKGGLHPKSHAPCRRMSIICADHSVVSHTGGRP